ncbi:MAG: hypothetical protein CMJ47_08540 [Planctomyces sp.]|nr:hypothetical protein [Planctomyces sp.]
MIDLLLLAILGVTTWVVASEGAWGATLNFFCVLFAGLLAMNFFEPTAELLAANVPLGASWRNRWDFIALMGLFILLVSLFRVGTEQLMPNFLEVHPIAHDGIRWVAAAATGYVTIAIVLTSLHTANLPRTFVGFEPARDNFLGMAAPDRQWIGFTQYVTEKAYRRGENGPVFDGSQVTLTDGKQVYLPSFVIRYATRRGQGAGAETPATMQPEVVTPIRPSAPPGGVNF